MDKVEMLWCSDYCKKHWKNDVEHIIRIANDVSNKTFIFDLPWDMEPTAEEVKFKNDIKWDYMPNKDVEFIYQMNRHRYWICLGQAYAMTNDEKYVKTFMEQLVSWVKNNPLNEYNKKTTWRTIEAGLRIENWIKSLEYFKHSRLINKEFLDIFWKSLEEHADYLYSNNSKFSIKSNWGILENSGLFLFSFYDKRQTKLKYRKMALDRLMQQADIQIMDDGVHWEQSPMYHVEVLHCFMEVIKNSEKHKVKLTGKFKNKIKSMLYYLMISIKPNNCQIMQGDSDETDLRDILTEGAFLFSDSRLKYIAYSRLDFESVWNFGKKATIKYESLKSEKPKFKNKLLEDSGNYYLRSDWNDKANYLHFRCGNLGGGHGNFDKLHIDLVFSGEDIIMDSGRYTYVEGEDRNWFKQAKAHNVPLLNNEEYSTCIDSWGVKNLAFHEKIIKSRKGDYTFLKAAHGGYISKGVYIVRKIIAIKTDIYVIVDEFYSAEKENTYSQSFHFNSKGRVELSDKKVTYIGETVNAYFNFISSDIEVTKEETRLSRKYNEFEKNETIKISSTKEGFSSIITVVTKEKSEVSKLKVTNVSNSKVLEDDSYEAVKIEMGNEEYTVIVGHKETCNPCDLVESNSVMGIGSVIVGSKKNNYKSKILYW